MRQCQESDTKEQAMNEGCQQMPAECVHAFQEMAVHYARLNECYESLDAKLQAVSKAVVGNGSPKDSLVARMERLESSAETGQRYGDRFWKVFGVLAAVTAVIVAIIR